MENEGISFKEKRVKSITNLYYSRPEIQKAIYDFSLDREISPSFMMKGFGKRPDMFHYPGDIFEMVKKGATSFHCSEEIWSDPLSIKTGMSEKEANELRTGWDFIIDIDSKYLDYSKILAEQIIKVLEFHGVKNIGIKFSGSKGFHLIVPWKAFPKEVNGVQTKDMFPEFPRIISRYISDKTKKALVKKITGLTIKNKYVRDEESADLVVPDIILVSSRHLFRMPYSLHEKTALASVVLNKDEIMDFLPRDADPLKAQPKNFMPNSKEGEATELLMQALDWYKDQEPESNNNQKNNFSGFKPIKIEKLSDDFLPPSIKKILEGVRDGRKRAVFILINLFRSLGIDREEVEKRIYDWNEKNEVPLKKGYIKAQLSWSYRNKIVPPPNFDKDYYKGIGAVPSPEELRLKNPVNFVLRKSKVAETK